MGDLKPQPPLPDIVCSTPPAFCEPTPPQFLRKTLLLAVREGFERLTLRPGEVVGCGYDMVGLYHGEEFGIVGPTEAVAQEIPAILDDLGQPAGTPNSSGRSGQGHVNGCETGEFVFQIGPGSVRVTYRVRWERGLVAELEITVPPATETVAKAAGHELRAQARAVWGDDTEA